MTTAPAPRMMVGGHRIAAVMPELARLFVYGTLLPGQCNAGLLRGARRVGPAVTVARFELLDLGEYPALRAGGATNVKGEIFLVDVACVARLDVFEGHPTLFERGSIALAGGGTALAYLVPAGARRTPARPIPGGDWRLRRRAFG